MLPFNPSGPPRPRPPNSSVEWYNDTEDFPLGQEILASDQIVLEPTPSDTNFLSKQDSLSARVRTRSNSSLEGKAHVFIPSSQVGSGCGLLYSVGTGGRQWVWSTIYRIGTGSCQGLYCCWYVLCCVRDWLCMGMVTGCGVSVWSALDHH